MPNVKPGGGRTVSKTCLIRGREDEGRKAILASKEENTRIAPIGDDGLTMDGSERVPTSDLIDIRPVIESSRAQEAPVPAIMGERGTITIPSAIRRRCRLQAGSPVLIEVRGDSILIRPAEIRPRGAVETQSLEELVAGITPENIHEEIPTGGAAGREVW